MSRGNIRNKIKDLGPARHPQAHKKTFAFKHLATHRGDATVLQAIYDLYQMKNPLVRVCHQGETFGFLGYRMYLDKSSSWLSICKRVST